MLLFLTTNMAAVTSLANQQYFHNTKIDFFLISVNKFQYFKVYFEKVSTKSAG